jgi:hypothetical protein
LVVKGLGAVFITFMQGVSIKLRQVAVAAQDDWVLVCTITLLGIGYMLGETTTTLVQ